MEQLQIWDSHRTLSGRFATDCARSCSFASTEGRLVLSSTDAEYSLKAAFKASVSCALTYRDRVVRNTNRRVLQNLYRKGAAFRL